MELFQLWEVDIFEYLDVVPLRYVNIMWIDLEQKLMIMDVSTVMLKVPPQLFLVPH